MASIAFVTGVIARRFGYSQAAAAGIAEFLQEDDRELVELATRHPGGSAQIAAVIMAARTRAAERLTNQVDRLRALTAARQEANQLYRTVELESLRRNDSAEPGPYRRRHGLRVVKVSDLRPPEAGE